jgi:hypothetical protein
MKVVHTYSSRELIWKEQMYVMFLSALYAKRHYGNIDLYCSDIQEQQFKELPSLYSNIITNVASNEFKIYSHPKLLTYLDQKEPFLHIDHDTVIYRKLKLGKVPFKFSHPEIKQLLKRPGNLGVHIPLLFGGQDDDYNYVNKSYIELYKTLLDKIPEGIRENVDFEHIPNMNVTYVNDVETFNLAVRNSLDYYNANKTIVDNHEFGAHHIEQFMIHQQLRTLSKEYKKSIKKGKAFLQPKTPLAISMKSMQKLAPSIKDTKFPFKFLVYRSCECCKRVSILENKISSIEDIKEYFGYKFNGYTHFSFMQWYQLWQVIIINEIVEEFGVEYVQEIHKYFKKVYPEHDLPPLSEAEITYEKLSGKKIF